MCACVYTYIHTYIQIFRPRLLARWCCCSVWGSMLTYLTYLTYPSYLTYLTYLILACVCVCVCVCVLVGVRACQIAMAYLRECGRAATVHSKVDANSFTRQFVLLWAAQPWAPLTPTIAFWIALVLNSTSSIPKKSKVWWCILGFVTLTASCSCMLTSVFWPCSSLVESFGHYTLYFSRICVQGWVTLDYKESKHTWL